MLTRPVGPLRKVRITDDLSLVHVVQLVNHHQKLHEKVRRELGGSDEVTD